MTGIDIDVLIILQIAIDIVLIVILLGLWGKNRRAKSAQPFNKDVVMFESVMKDADRIAEEFDSQLKEKSRLVKELVEQLDSKLSRINMMLNRAESILAQPAKEWKAPSEASSELFDRHRKIIDLSRNGRNVEEIADILSVPKGEVQLVLQMNREEIQSIASKQGLGQDA